jgi:hypothetical protein
VPRVEFHHADGRRTLGGQPADVTQHLAASTRRLEARPHGGIVCRQTAKEFVDRTLLEARRHQTLNLDVRHLELESHLATEDDQLAGDVHAGQIVARIRLRVAPLLRLGDDVAEFARPVIDIEQVSECPEKIPSMLVTSSPVSRRSRKVWITGSPAPTVAS